MSRNDEVSRLSWFVIESMVCHAVVRLRREVLRDRGKPLTPLPDAERGNQGVQRDQVDVERQVQQKGGLPVHRLHHLQEVLDVREQRAEVPSTSRQASSRSSSHSDPCVVHAPWLVANPGLRRRARDSSAASAACMKWS